MVVMSGPGPAAAMGGGGPMGMNSQNVTWVPASELPDYKPPFFNGNVRPDGDGNIWVLTIPTRGIPGGPVYDVINGKGDIGSLGGDPQRVARVSVAEQSAS